MIGEIVLSNPRRKNAISLPQLEQLAIRIENDTADVLVLRGADGDFCAGFDLTTLEDADDIVERSAAALVRVIDALHEHPGVTIANVSGVAYGAGLGIALGCDLRVVAVDARLCMPVVRLGGAYPTELVASFVDAVGVAATSELFLTGRVVDGAEAVRIGLAHRTAEHLDVLLEEVGSGVPAAATHFKRQLARLRNGGLTHAG